ncbi:hypothetical protein NST21_11105 [Peribacillus sp. FSL K6-1552]|uniref:hypothetical protein n=1 Tax=Peribacillus sp. FSL K6-1552 TaxID=2954514 RepID=UPI0030FA04E0
MKKLLFPFLALVMSLTLTACNNNNDTNGISQQEPSGDTSQQEMSEFSRELHDCKSRKCQRGALHEPGSNRSGAERSANP